MPNLYPSPLTSSLYKFALFPSHLAVVTGQSPSVCITSLWADGVRFSIVLSIPRLSPAPQQHAPKQGNFLSPVPSGVFCHSHCQPGKLKHLNRNNSCLAKSQLLARSCLPPSFPPRGFKQQEEGLAMPSGHSYKEKAVRRESFIPPGTPQHACGSLSVS